MIFISVLLLVAGVAGLVFGADFLVRGASSIATRLGVSAFIVGMTVVAFGTSMPELVVSLRAALTGHEGIVVGNIIGSNIANIGLILGLTALAWPVSCKSSLVRRETLIMVLVALAFGVFMLDGQFSRSEGGVLFLGFIGFLALQFRAGSADIAASSIGTSSTSDAAANSSRVLVDLAMVLAGLILLAVGGEFVVRGASNIARSLGISELIIGLTIVAIGTSLPELATSVVAAFRRETDMVFGNILGSNIFNMLLVGGTTTLIVPFGVPPESVRLDIWVVVAFSLAVVPMVWVAPRVNRIEGGILLLGYITYLTVLTALAMSS